MKSVLLVLVFILLAPLANASSAAVKSDGSLEKYFACVGHGYCSPVSPAICQTVYTVENGDTMLGQVIGSSKEAIIRRASASGAFKVSIYSCEAL